MGLFGNKPPQEEPLFKTNYLGFWIKVYPNRVEFKSGIGSQSIPINQIASVQLAMMGVQKITLETTGGKKYAIPIFKKKEVQEAIYQAQNQYNQKVNSQTSESPADEVAKLHALKEKGVITQEEFDKKKKQLLNI